MSCSTMTSDSALGNDRRDARVDVADHDRSEAEADLVAQQQRRIRHQRAADGDHLLLAAGQRRARLVAAFLQHRKQLVDALRIPRTLAAELAADQEIFLDGERGKQPPSLRHQRDAARHHLVRRSAADRHAMKHDGVVADRHRAGDAFQQRRFAGAVGADHRHHLALGDAHRDAEQRLEVAVMGVERAHLQQRISHRPVDAHVDFA